MKNPTRLNGLLFICLLTILQFSCESSASSSNDKSIDQEKTDELKELKTPEDEGTASQVSLQSSEKKKELDESKEKEKKATSKLKETKNNPLPVEEPTSNNSTTPSRNAETLMQRIVPPEGFNRSEETTGSFGHYLQNLPLKPKGTEVKYYNGAVKANRGVYVAVVDLDVGKRDLQQCADAVMRLRGEYLWHQKKYDQIHFNFTNGFRVDYDKWRQGYRVQFNGNNTSWKKSAQASNSYQSFRKYMDLIFAYAGTASLEKELKKASLDDLQIGDVFIKGGFPGHAVIVVDMAIHQVTGEKIFLLAQSYMPAQDIQILSNPNDRNLSPWYRSSGLDQLDTPEWTFYNVNPKRF